MSTGACRKTPVGSLTDPVSQIETYYYVTYTGVALLFLSSFVGYVITALSNNLIHNHFG